MYCQKCGKEMQGNFCTNCGNKAANATPQNITNQTIIQNQSQNTLPCPKCGSKNLEIISDVEGKGASFWKLCFCGLLGLCGTGKTTTTHYWVCKKCGYKFKM